MDPTISGEKDSAGRFHVVSSRCCLSPSSSLFVLPSSKTDRVPSNLGYCRITFLCGPGKKLGSHNAFHTSAELRVLELIPKPYV